MSHEPLTRGDLMSASSLRVDYKSPAMFIHVECLFLRLSPNICSQTAWLFHALFCACLLKDKIFI